MVLVPGRAFWVGSAHKTFEQEENPRFLTRVAPFCLDETEVTTRAYEACVDAGRCSPAGRDTVTCNFRREGREDHPINCVDYPRAEAVCAEREPPQVTVAPGHAAAYHFAEEVHGAGPG